MQPLQVEDSPRQKVRARRSMHNVLMDRSPNGEAVTADDNEGENGSEVVELG